MPLTPQDYQLNTQAVGNLINKGLNQQQAEQLLGLGTNQNRDVALIGRTASGNFSWGDFADSATNYGITQPAGFATPAPTPISANTYNQLGYASSNLPNELKQIEEMRIKRADAIKTQSAEEMARIQRSGESVMGGSRMSQAIEGGAGASGLGSSTTKTAQLALMQEGLNRTINEEQSRLDTALLNNDEQAITDSRNRRNELFNQQFQLQQAQFQQQMATIQENRAAADFGMKTKEFNQNLGKEVRDNIFNIAKAAAENGADAQTLNKITNSLDAATAIQNAGGFLNKNQKDEYMSVSKDSFIFNKTTGQYILNPVANNSLASGSDKLTMVAQLGRMIFGSKISDSERNFMTNIIDTKIQENPNISNSDLRFELMKQLTGFDVQNNKDIAGGLMDAILQSSGQNGIASFDMVGLSQLLNDNNIAGAITKVENYALNEQRKLDPQSYFGETAASITVNFANELAKKINNLGGIGNFKGTIEKWLGKFKGTNQQSIASDITNMMADWRRRYAGTAVTETELAFLTDAIPSIADRTEQMAVKLQSLQNAALLQYNNTRQNINLPVLNLDNLLDKSKRASLYKISNDTTNDTSAITGGNFITPEYKSWLGKQENSRGMSLNPNDKQNLFQYYKEQNPNIDDDVIRQSINDIMGFNQVGGDTKKAAMRTDRHNNPTAFTTDIAKQAGLKENIDYKTGDSFAGGKTALLLGNPIDTTIKVIDKIGFYTSGGKQRWTHTAMPQSQWKKLSYTQKKDVIQKMYQLEGNGGALNQYFT